jgi:hypothetical protein
MAMNRVSAGRSENFDLLVIGNSKKNNLLTSLLQRAAFPADESNRYIQWGVPRFWAAKHLFGRSKRGNGKSEPDSCNGHFWRANVR